MALTTGTLGNNTPMFQAKKRIHHREHREFCVDFSVFSVVKKLE
jgi:hypothetical protein